MRMTYPTNSLGLALDQVDRLILDTKTQSLQAKAAFEGGSVSASKLIDLAIQFSRAIDSLDLLAATPGLVQFARDQKNDQGLDILVEYNAVKTGMQSVVDWLLANFPTNGGFLLRETWGPNGPVDRQFTSPETAALSALLGTLAGLIS